MVSLHAPHLPPALSLWGMVIGVILAPVVILGTLFLLVRPG